MIDEITTRLLVLSMDMQQYKQQVTAVNVANVNTAGYTAKTVNFDTVLESLSQSHTRTELMQRIGAYQGERIEDLADVRDNHKHQSVKLDEEVLASSQAAGKYQTMAELLNRRLGLVRMGIKG
ncbi:flagellar basal body protein [Vibrio sp. MEBiC08052]|uniref:flagellar basal body protein n=1 Tax=Vibrio sp. MEBiC08052 TaxID=1761910 RepID=UPI0007405D94|nr:flagellar basal body protein [Vibrio sp. MEBiC08052]KUI97023.1 hypothetical protein VRK_38780 [Vibrio sp. MEBiC08052]